MSEEHPVLADLKSLCNLHGLGEDKAQAAFALYTQLHDGRKILDICHHFHDELRLFYLTGKVKNSEVRELYIPMIVDASFTVDYLETLYATFWFQNEDYRVIMAFKETGPCSPGSSVIADWARPFMEDERNHHRNNLNRYRGTINTWTKMLHHNTTIPDGLAM